MRNTVAARTVSGADDGPVAGRVDAGAGPAAATLAAGPGTVVAVATGAAAATVDAGAPVVTGAPVVGATGAMVVDVVQSVGASAETVTGLPNGSSLPGQK